MLDKQKMPYQKEQKQYVKRKTKLCEWVSATTVATMNEQETGYQKGTQTQAKVNPVSRKFKITLNVLHWRQIQN